MAKPKIDSKIDIPDQVLKEILTPSEWRMLKNRWKIVNLLEEGSSIRQVAKEVRVGTDTVVRVARMIERKDLRKILDNLLGQKRTFKTSTPWIFGKGR